MEGKGLRHCRAEGISEAANDGAVGPPDRGSGGDGGAGSGDLRFEIGDLRGEGEAVGLGSGEAETPKASGLLSNREGRRFGPAVPKESTLVKAPQPTDWGGYGGYFADPDGYLWEVAWSERTEFEEDGSVKM